MGWGSWSKVCPGRGRLAGAQTGVVSCTEYIQPVCLPAAGQALVDGKICTVTGWGNTQYYGESCPLLGGCLRETLSWAGEGQLGYASASWTRGCRDTEAQVGGQGRGCACSPASASLARTPPGQQAGVLQEARVPIISNDVCNGPDFYGNQIKPKMFCAGYPEGGIDACQVRDAVRQPGPWPPQGWRHRALGGRAPYLRARGLYDHSPRPSKEGLLASRLGFQPGLPSPTRATVVAPSCVRIASLGRHVGGCVAL